MPRPKLSGPCAIANCTKHTPFYRSFTENVYKTAQREDTLIHFAYLQVGDHLCCSHYNNIVASNCNKKRKSSSTHCVKQVGVNSECRVGVNVNREGEKGMKSRVYFVAWYLKLDLRVYRTMHNKELLYCLQTILLENKLNCLQM